MFERMGLTCCKVRRAILDLPKRLFYQLEDRIIALDPTLKSTKVACERESRPIPKSALASVLRQLQTERGTLLHHQDIVHAYAYLIANGARLAPAGKGWSRKRLEMRMKNHDEGVWVRDVR